MRADAEYRETFSQLPAEPFWGAFSTHYLLSPTTRHATILRWKYTNATTLLALLISPARVFPPSTGFTAVATGTSDTFTHLLQYAKTGKNSNRKIRPHHWWPESSSKQQILIVGTSLRVSRFRWRRHYFENATSNISRARRFKYLRANR